MKFTQIKQKKLLEETPPDAIVVDSSSLEFKPQIFDTTCFNALIQLLKQQGNNCDILIDATVKYQNLNDYLSSSHNNIFFVASLSKYFYKEWIYDLQVHSYIRIIKNESIVYANIPER